jgi:antitoxin protein of toxin-antitoxin system
MSFLDRAKELADQHDDKFDQALERAGDLIDERTGEKYTEHIDRGVDLAQEHTGSGDTTRQQDPTEQQP